MRRIGAKWIGALLVGAVAMLLATALPGGRARAAETQYLTFQIFTAGPGFSTETGKRALAKLPDPGFLDGEAKKILDAVGERGDDHHRLGVVIGPLALDYTDAQLRTLIERTFAIASKYKIAVGLHIDDSKFWLNRKDLWNDPANVEWSDWKAPNTGQYLNWGEPWKIAPQACFNSPAMLKEARRLAGEVIGPAVAQQVMKLRQTGDEALFAGVIVGWETAIGQDYETRRDLGYCALANRGFSKAAAAADPDGELQTVVQNWIEAWSKSLTGAGLPSERIYSHITFISKKQYEGMHGAGGRSYARTVMYTPPSVAFGATHRPGFSTYPDPDVMTDIYAALAAHGNPPWASAEGTNVDIQSAPPAAPAQGMEDYLARMFNHGAALTNVFGWGIGEKQNPFRQATEGADAIAAYRKFLRGVRLDEGPLANSRHAGGSILQKLMRALPARIESYLHAGGDPQVIQPKVQQVEESMRAGRLDAMKEHLDQVEATIDAKLGGQQTAAAAGGFDIAALQQQMRALPQKIDTFQQRGGDINRIRARVESIQRHIGAGELEKAYEERQALDPILDSP